MVPFSSATTGLATPALINDWAPMIELVRPAQLTTTVVAADETASCTRYASSAPGQSSPPGIDMLRNSVIGRLSRMTRSSSAARRASSSAAEMRGVP